MFIAPKSQECIFAWKNIKLEFLHRNQKIRNCYKNRKSYMSVWLYYAFYSWVLDENNEMYPFGANKNVRACCL